MPPSYSTTAPAATFGLRYITNMQPVQTSRSGSNSLSVRLPSADPHLGQNL